MIIYSSQKSGFIDDVLNNQIDTKILEEMQRKLGHGSGKSEIASWINSLNFMYKILADDEIPDTASVSLEYTIPMTSKRIDFILAGKDQDKKDSAIVIELKQWTDVEKTDKDGIVKTFVGGTTREMPHPSYQAWTYAALLEDFNEAVHKEDIALVPCAYLHNCHSDAEVNDPFYESHTQKAPPFLKQDAKKLREFIKKHIKYGDADGIMYRIENGRIRPSKNLADSLSSLISGNQEFLLIDDQKVVYERCLSLAYKAKPQKKWVLIVEGGPGTGKSVVAINVLVELTKHNKLVQYVSKNAAPRTVYASKLAGTLRKTCIDNMFKGSGSYTDVAPGYFDALIVDEAHRLNEKSGLYQNLGDNQIKEIINAATFSVFFIDEDQRVTLKDIGTKAEIVRWAKLAGAEVDTLKLESQFRCNGSDGYLAWVDNVLGIRETANKTLDGLNYEFEVFDSPTAMRNRIREKNAINNKARMVAGYCWDWASKKDPKASDIVFPKYDFAMQWNLTNDGSLWIMMPESVDQIGCIHTCQGLEVDYVGVVIGPDLIVRDGKLITRPEARAKADSSIKGYKALLKMNPDEARGQAEMIIKNTYRTLMTRGQKGCYIFSDDPETNQYFRAMITLSTEYVVP